MPKFKILNKQIFKDYNLILKPISKVDIEKIRIWRNSQTSFLRQSKIISKEEQLHYFNNIIYPNFNLDNPKMILFSFFDKISDKLLGYGGFVHIDWINKTSEVSFLCDTKIMNDSQNYKSHFIDFMKIIINISREENLFNCLYSETFSFRKNHIQYLESVGYTMFGIKKLAKSHNDEKYSSFLHQKKI
tara:strand:- start:151 stop:714 length:564 start_codon:yes stop_codon:yes gene_type:complete